ncbi:MAG TPA: hypothetical protein ENI23_17580 [bacterium]|nr:hypothetical protein [bacterium]
MEFGRQTFDYEGGSEKGILLREQIQKLRQYDWDDPASVDLPRHIRRSLQFPIGLEELPSDLISGMDFGPGDYNFEFTNLGNFGQYFRIILTSKEDPKEQIFITIDDSSILIDPGHHRKTYPHDPEKYAKVVQYFGDIDNTVPLFMAIADQVTPHLSLRG